MKNPLPLIVVLALVAASAAIHGAGTGRWASASALDEALARLADVPLVLGDWRGEPVKTDGERMARSGAAAHWARRYQNPRLRASVTVILMVGRSGPMSDPAPDLCFGGAPLVPLGPTEKHLALGLPGTAPAEFLVGRHRNGGPQVRVLTAWSVGGRWEAPEQPGLVLRGLPVLFKLQLIQELGPGRDALDQGPVPALLKELLPAAGKALFVSPPV